MSGPVRQSNLFAAEDFLKIYRSFRDVNFTAYDYDSIRSALTTYIRQQYPEDFNDFIESSEYIALIELLAYLGSSLSLRIDLNSRENFLDTAERRESIIRLARMLSYNPQRRIAAKGLFKIVAVQTSEPLTDSLGRSLQNKTIFWNDANNEDSFEQFIAIINRSFNTTNQFGKPTKSGKINNISTDLYQINSILPRSVTNAVNLTTTEASLTWNVVNPDFTNNETFFERHPDPYESFNLIYRNDGAGLGSKNTGFFLFLKQGKLNNVVVKFDLPIKNRVFNLNATGVNQEDVYFQEVNDDGSVVQKWTKVPSLVGNNVIFNSLNLEIRDIFNAITEYNDGIKLKFTDGEFGNVPKGLYRVWYRTSHNGYYTLRPENASNMQLNLPYIGKNGEEYTLTIFYRLEETINNSVPSETNEQIKLNAPAVFYTQNRMVNAEDYNVFPLSRGNEIVKIRSINRTHAGHSRFIDINDPSGIIQNVKLFAEDGAIYKDYEPEKLLIELTTTSNLETLISENLFLFLRNQRLNNFFYDNYYKQYINSNPLAFNFESLGYKWSTVPNTGKSPTGFFYNSLDPAATEIWQFNGSTWSNGTTSVQTQDGLPLNVVYYYNITNYTGIQDGQYYVSGGMIHFTNNYTPTVGDSLTILYKIPINLNIATNTYITSGAIAIFINPYNRAEKKSFTIRTVMTGGLPGTTSQPTTGPVTLSTDLEDGWILKEVLPAFRVEFTASELESIITQIELQNDFAIGYNIETDYWYVIPSSNLFLGNLSEDNFSLSSMNSENNSSWLLYFNYLSATDTGNEPQYEITSRGRKYVFESLKEVRFFYSPEQRAIDVQTGKEKQDEIWLLEVNQYQSSNLEVWEYNGTNWINGSLIYPNSVGIVLATKQHSGIEISTSSTNEISVNDINDRGILVTNEYSWAANDTITIEYKFVDKLQTPIIWNIDRSFILEDGYLDQTKIEVKPVDSDEDGTPDSPFSFDDFVDSQNEVYFERYFDFDGYEYFRPWKTGYNTVINPSAIDFINGDFDGYPIADTGIFLFNNENDIKVFISNIENIENYATDLETFENVPTATILERQYNYAKLFAGKIIRNMDTGIFYDIPLIVPPTKLGDLPIETNFANFTIDTDHFIRVGRSLTLNTFDKHQIPLWFKWKHYSPNINRIDPSISNIIDMYILTTAYNQRVDLWKKEKGARSAFPVPPTTEELRIQFGDLNKYKMLSDEIIYQSATFKLLFGQQADPEYRVKFKVVKLSSTFVSDSEIKSKVIQAVDEYFDLSNWDFGESFFYTELAAYIHQQLTNLISTIIIVPTKQESTFGDLFQIKAEPTELFLSVATVQDVEIVNTLTDANMRLQ